VKRSLERACAALALLAAHAGCRGDSAREAPSIAASGVRVLVVPSMEPPDLGAAPGHDETFASCQVCHSLRYVTDQPALSRKQWSAEVDKMMKSYGAPVPPEHVPRIVDYLVAVHGVKDD
jgi:cytochrome c5